MATALYRRYRPDTFADVIGQEHVTDPLRAALRSGKVGQAYLFSGPRGCGKTTSARILARCLNCAQGPTDTPCGTCDSCVELARGGPGSLDVVEIDAASHGGVDDARELRERATFAPARDRLKIFIIDEAHMVSSQGFNALLKIVEEPPPHIVFLFATTEPDKVLGTIRSRTHHYPFRLVPPQVLQAHLQQVCDAEGVAVGPGVLPLVVRAGAGSVRDSLSVLDQLAAGAGDAGIEYEGAVSLLGYTHATLLDDVTAAFAAGDGATVFHVVDRVISSGQDPRRFVDDLLQRLRDLVVVLALGDRAREVFPGLPADQLERMGLQAAGFGAAQLSRAADLANAAATEMTGATSPRLHLELLCARMLLPAADDGERGLAARLDRVERRLSVPGGAPAAGEGPAQQRHERPAAQAPASDPSSDPRAVGPGVPLPGGRTADAADESRGARHVREVMARRRDPGAPAEAPAPTSSRGAATPDQPQAPPSAAPPWDAPEDQAPVQEPAPASSEAAAEPHPGAAFVDGDVAEQPSSAAEPDGARNDTPPVTVPVSPDPVGGPPSGEPGGLETTEAVRRMWPDVLEHLATVKRRTWTRVSQDAQVTHVDEQRLVLQFARPNTLQAFSSGPHAEFVREALIAVLGLDRVVIAVNAGAPLPAGVGPGGATSRPTARPEVRRPQEAPPAQPAPRPEPPVTHHEQSAPRDEQPAPRDERARTAEQPPRSDEGPPPEGGLRREPAQEPETPAARASGPPEGPTATARGSAAADQPSGREPRDAGHPAAAASRTPPEGRRGATSPQDAPSRQRPRQRGAAAPPPWDDIPPPEAPDEGEPPPPEFDDPWTSEGQARSTRAPSSSSPPSAAALAAAPATATRVTAAPATAAPETPPAPEARSVTPRPAPTTPAATPAASAAPSRQAPSGPLRGADLARSAMRARTGLGGPGEAAAPDAARPAEDEPSRDDPDADGSGQVGLAVVERVLGGRVLSIDERS